MGWACGATDMCNVSSELAVAATYDAVVDVSLGFDMLFSRCIVECSDLTPRPPYVTFSGGACMCHSACDCGAPAAVGGVLDFQTLDSYAFQSRPSATNTVRNGWTSTFSDIRRELESPNDPRYGTVALHANVIMDSDGLQVNDAWFDTAAQRVGVLAGGRLVSESHPDLVAYKTFQNNLWLVRANCSVWKLLLRWDDPAFWRTHRVSVAQTTALSQEGKFEYDREFINNAKARPAWVPAEGGSWACKSLMAHYLFSDDPLASIYAQVTDGDARTQGMEPLRPEDTSYSSLLINFPTVFGLNESLYPGGYFVSYVISVTFV